MSVMKFVHIIVVALVLAFTGSCENTLVESPRDIISPDQFYNSDKEAIAGVNGVYANLPPFFGAVFGRDLGYWSHDGTDLSFPTAGRFMPWGNYQLSTSNPGNVSSHWQDFYRAIGDANQVINRVSNSESISDNIKNRVLGEAKVLRAFFYYYLTAMFGDVPLWLDELNVDEVSSMSRTSVDEVRNQMVEDLTSPEVQNLPSTFMGSDKGRITQWAAKMLLAKTYLWQENWQGAKDVIGDIIQNSPHQLLAEFDDIFGIENEYNNEIIWELDFNQDLNRSRRTSRFVPRGIDEPDVPGYNFNGFALVTVAPEFVDSFNPVDKRLPIYNWNGANGVQTNNSYCLKWIDWEAPRANSGVNAVVYRLADAYLIYAEVENELNGPTPDAYDKINTLRQRAGLPDLSGLTQDGFRQAVMDERKWELAFEFHRRWDLARWGKLVEAVQTMTESNPEGAQNVEPHHRLAPIPPQEIEKNPNLTQNPGY